MSDNRNKWLAGTVSVAVLAGASMWEGTVYTPYEDIAGVLTVCKGHTGWDIVPGKKYTPAECDAYLKKELGDHAAGVLACTNVPITQGQFDAYTLFAYNVGTAAYCNSSLLKKLNAGDARGACYGLMDWNKAKVNGQLVPVKGLTNRRQFEMSMCLKGLK